MSPHLHYELGRNRQQEIAASITHAHHVRAARASFVRTRRTVSARVRNAIAAAGVCLAAATAIVSVAPANPGPAGAGTHPSAAQLSREIRGLEARGFVQWSCTVKGMLMRNPRTGQVVTVKS